MVAGLLLLGGAALMTVGCFLTWFTFGEDVTGFTETGLENSVDAGGYLTMAAALCTPAVAGAISAGEAGGLMHGPTFMGNPLACAVAVANLDLLIAGDWPAQLATLRTGLQDGLTGLLDAPGVHDVRVLGGVGVVQTAGPFDVAAVTAVALEHGVWLRPFRDLIYTMPPYLSTAAEVATITGAITAAVRTVIR